MPSTEPDDVVHVAVGVIEGKDNRILLTRRPDYVHQGGKWEFPGGKLEEGESVQDALTRELEEELAIIPLNTSPLIRIPYRYPEKTVLLDVWKVSNFSGQAHPQEGQPMQWVDKAALYDLEFPEANRPIIHALNLPESVLITPPNIDHEQILTGLERSLRGKSNMLVYLRETQATEEIRLLARSMGAEIIERYHTAVSLASGLHLTSERLMSMDTRPRTNGLLLSASCHNIEQIEKANQLSLDFIFLSPVKATGTHPDAEPIGWQQFSDWVEHASMPVYGLGGMSRSDIAIARKHGGQGIAAISAMWVFD